MDSATEYFEHFPVLEIDFTFYLPLRDQDGKLTQTFQVLRAYRQHLRDGDPLLLKVPQVVTALKLRRGGQYRDNPAYLNDEVFTASSTSRLFSSWARPWPASSLCRTT